VRNPIAARRTSRDSKSSASGLGGARDSSTALRSAAAQAAVLSCFSWSSARRYTVSATGVEVVGEATGDYAINVQLDGRDDSLTSPWLSKVKTAVVSAVTFHHSAQIRFRVNRRRNRQFVFTIRLFRSYAVAIVLTRHQSPISLAATDQRAPLRLDRDEPVHSAKLRGFPTLPSKPQRVDRKPLRSYRRRHPD
jgi:hypothetical protein